MSDCAWICLQAFSSILCTIFRSASPECHCHSGHLRTSVGWWSSLYILPSLWGTLVSWVDLLKSYLRGGTSSPGYRSLLCFWDITVRTWERVYYEGPASGERGLEVCISISSSSISSTSLIFTEDHLDGVSGGEKVSQLCHGPVVIYCMVYHYTKRATLARLLTNEGPAIYVVHLNRYFVIPPWYYLVVTFCNRIGVRKERLRHPPRA